MVKLLNWKKFDQVGMTLSFFCAIHCLALPILIPILPFLAGSFIAGGKAEYIILSITLLIATPTLFRGYLKHRNFRVLAIFFVGLLFLFLRPDSTHHDHVHDGEFLHFILAALAGFSLAIGHWLNIRLCKSCPTCKEHKADGYCH